MKQTKKLTRDQHRFLQKKGYDSIKWRLVQDTKEYLLVMTEKSEVMTVFK